MPRPSATKLVEKARSGEKLVCLTAYDAPTAGLIEAAGVDLILVGDSMGNVVLGYPDTRPVSLDMMIHHTGAVMRGTRGIHVCADLPFGTYQVSPADAKRNVARLVGETGCQSVKLEGGKPWYGTVSAIGELGVDVMGHLGHTPQSMGHRPSRAPWTPAERDALIEQAKGLEKAGCFAIVLEVVPALIAKQVTEAVAIPTIGIGSGPHCSGQVLVLHDILGIGPDLPHAKRYEEVGDAIKRAASRYVDDVRTGRFPGKEHGFD
jgi:3-methyl-2-oxobutanoate hydroxymethyltransferase